ncbi:MAG TPA: PD-(D/E)XK nuclease family protein [Acidobacteriaceae bacterium]|nr:PD-(D/E)XK nuclease family protein [Acidobacteriaceae bacterium]
MVAASPRAARALGVLHARDQRAAGHEVWPCPAIFDWDSWIRSLWHTYAFATPDAPLLLSSLQERALWTRVQRSDAGLVLSPESMAALAMEAWSLLSSFGAHSARRHCWEPADAERFRQWAQEFDRECAAQGWLSASQIESRLCGAAAENLGLPPELCLVGFDRLTPAQEEFLNFLRARGIAVVEHLPEPCESRRAWIAAGNRHDEIAACAAWARQLLLDQPYARIGVIAPAIGSSRGETERAFRRALLPSADDIRRPFSALPFEFSLGQPLADVPAVRAALLLLCWIARPLQDEEISWLLLSGFLADTATHHLDMARRDASRRDSGLLVPERSLESFRASLDSTSALRPPAERIDALLQAVDASRVLDQPRPPSAWTELLPLLLERIGWPGERASDSVQFQALQRWHRLLDEMALLDFDGAVLLFTDFLDLLDLHAREMVFAPESDDPPIHILGPLESAGQQFDAIWFLSADDSRWPVPGSPHPLLPPAVQRQYGMPHATPQNDWDLAHVVTTRLLRSAPQIVFSYAQHDEDAELRPSPLLKDLFPHDAQPQPAATIRPESARNASLETIPDGSVALPWPSERPAGGADVLKRQAACPFQSFATRRLAAEPLDAEEWGFTPAERGKLLHRVLERLYSLNLTSQDDLLAVLAARELPGLLDAHIEAVFRDFAKVSGSWQEAYLAAEKRRLRARLEEWLTCEAQRLPFAVEATERKLSGVRIGDLLLDLRADRIDLLPDGSHFLIDYKTGRISSAAWNGERPEEPQLPLYAVCGNVERLSGVLFAKIRAGETGFDGRVRDARTQLFANLSPGRKLVSDPFTDSMRDQWSRALHALAQEFLDGESAVSPRQPEVCRNCSLSPLCRKAELALAVSGDDEEDDADA